ncbi:hypothetical protein OC842_002221 [Tilletia horrida]|uniref:COG complex component COG2 C-terminal domain-containing protein n=1 Tax=Tilletia horrida TaxID=155126 RepID=A0AAN6GDL2_9BASI|nr:hypothetical protein OC842_002221 [Tilletia horrida]
MADAAPRSRPKHAGSRGAGAGADAGGSAGSGSLDGIKVNFGSLDLVPLSLAEPHPLLDGTGSSSAGAGATVDFDPDEFLCSRATGTKLHSIVAELESHHDELQQHLLTLVQSHAAAFQQLRTAVQRDANTVEQLGQVNFQLALADRRASSTAAAVEALSRRSSDAQQAGIDHVRRVVERTRDRLQDVKVDVDALTEERNRCTQVQSQLSVLLALHQCILRLETLLGIPASSYERKRTAGRTVSGDSSSSTARNVSGSNLRPGDAPRHADESEGDEDEEEDEADAILNSMGGLSGDGKSQLARMEEYGMHGLSSDAEEHDLGHDADVEADLLGLYSQVADDIQQAFPIEQLGGGADPLSSLIPSLTPAGAPHMSPKSRRKSLAARRRSSAQSISMSQATTALWLPSNGAGPSGALSLNPLPEILPLPQRLAKAVDELSHLISLVQQALKENLRTFVQARTRRLTGIANALASDLNMLLSQLLDTSSLVFRPVQRLKVTDGALLRAADAPADSLLGWTQIDKEGTEDDGKVLKQRRKEQFGWLRLSFRSYAALDDLLRSAGSIGTDAASTASEALRQDLDATLRTGCLSIWIRARLRASPYTLLIKHSAEPGAAAREARVDADPDIFPHALEGTPQIPAASPPPATTEDYDAKSSDSLRRLYNEVLRFLAEDARGLLRAAQEAHNAASEWHVDAFSTLWDEISRALLEDLGNVIFFVGRPDSFQQNYNLTARFLQLVARLAPSSTALKALQDHPGFIAFQKRWQLSVYFRIRLRAIITALEAGLSNGLALIRRNATDGDMAQLQGIQATLDAFATPWQPWVHIRPLTAREWTLSLQIVSRFKTWLENEVLSDAAAASHSDGPSYGGEADGMGHRRTPSSSSWKGGSGRDSPNPRARVDSPSLGESRQQREADEQRLLRWTCVASDVEWLEGSLWKVFEHDIVPAVRVGLATDLDGQVASPAAEEVLKDMKDALYNALSYRRGFVAVLGRNIVALLKQRCAASFEVLNRTGSITRQYRAAGGSSSGGGAIVVPSQTFVAQMIAPLQDYFSGGGPGSQGGSGAASQSIKQAALARLEAEVRSAWAQEVVDDVVGRYATALFTMNKTLESLRRLKRGSTTLGFGSLFGGGGGGGSSASTVNTAVAASAAAGGTDSDPESVRTRKQMRADVAALEAEIQGLQSVGVNVVLEGHEAWERLLRAASGQSEG